MVVSGMRMKHFPLTYLSCHRAMWYKYFMIVHEIGMRMKHNKDVMFCLCVSVNTFSPSCISIGFFLKPKYCLDTFPKQARDAYTSTQLLLLDIYSS